MATRNAEKPDYAPMRQSLENKFESLTRQMESLRADVRAGSESARGSFAEVEDRASNTSMLEDTLAEEQRLVGEMEDVDIALKKLKAGTYGKCERCGCPIKIERLTAVPTARFCFEDATVPGSAESCISPDDSRAV